jgi:hypothetical protein
MRYQDTDVKSTQIRLFRQGHVTERMERWHLGAAMQGVSYTYPLTDRRLMEFVLQVPDDLFLRDHINRYLYRKAMKPLFPPETIDVPEIHPKHDPSLLTHQKMLALMLRKHDAENAYRRMLERADNPWIEVERVGAFAARHGYQTNIRTADGHAYNTAVSLLYLWEDICRTRERQRSLRETASAPAP